MRMLILAAALLPWPALAQDTVVLPVKLLDTSNEARDQQADHARRRQLRHGQVHLGHHLPRLLQPGLEVHRRQAVGALVHQIIQPPAEGVQREGRFAPRA